MLDFYGLYTISSCFNKALLKYDILVSNLGKTL